jgi:hypothetical protein
MAGPRISSAKAAMLQVIHDLHDVSRSQNDQYEKH